MKIPNEIIEYVEKVLERGNRVEITQIKDGIAVIEINRRKIKSFPINS